MTTDEKIALFCKQGWVPVKWAHHPEPIKELIRKGNFKPKMKACFENSGKLVLASLGTEYEGRVKYVEGELMLKMGFPIAHAWVELDGVPHDLTLDDKDDQLIPLGRLTVQQLLPALLETGRWGDLLWGYDQSLQREPAGVQ